MKHIEEPNLTPRATDKPSMVEIPLPRLTPIVTIDFDYYVRFAEEQLALSHEEASSFADKQFEEITKYIGSLSPDDVFLMAQQPAEHWIVGRCIAATPKRVIWDLAGLFDTEDKAVRACRDESDFVMPVPVNVLLPQESCLNARAYYPLLTGPESKNNDAHHQAA